MEGIIKLEAGSYFDDDEVLHDPQGNELPDGLYKTEDGDVFMYEGNFERKFENLPKGD